MKRRDLVKAGLGASVAAAVGSRRATSVEARPANEPFSLNFAPEFRTFASSAGPDEIENLRFIHAAGFRAVQDIALNRRPIEQQTAIGNEAQRLGMTVGAFLINHRTFKTTDLVMGVPAACELFLTEVEEAVQTAQRVGAQWLIAVPGFEAPRLDRPRQIANIVELFKRASALLEPHGLIMVVEPVSWVDGALLIRDLADAHLLCKAVGSPSCKILCDLFHQQMQRGNLIDSMEQSWDEIAYFHIGDVPGRNEPTSGEINYRTVFSYIRAKGYRGVLGMEHGNVRPGRQGDAAVIAAYREVDQPDALSIEGINAALAQRSSWR